MARQGKKFGAGDIETDPFCYGEIPSAFCCGFYDGRRHRTWWGPRCVQEMVKFLLGFDGVVWFHNGGNFDFHFLLDHLPLEDCKFFCIGKRIVQIRVGDLDLRDSWAIIPHALKTWGKTEIDYEKLRAGVREKHREEILSYLRDDLTNLLEMASAFVERFGLSLTLASTAFKVLRTQFHVPILRTSQRFDSNFRDHYFAGRVEYKKLGRHVGRFECLDINSAFPNAMTFPHFYSVTYKTHFGKWPKKFKEQSFYIVTCTAAGGALAQRQKDKSIAFPLGGGEFHTNGWELMAGLRAGVVKGLKIKFAFSPTKVRDFGKFVRHFYEGKKDAGLLAKTQEAKGLDSSEARADEYFFKIILNSAYGKFGQDFSHYKDVAVTPWREEPEGDNWEVSFDDEARGITFWERPSPRRPRQKGEFYNVAVAASITGFVRAQLFQAIRLSRGFIYCDTDSIIAERVRVPRGTGLGEWKLERVFDVFWCGGKKLYVGHAADAPWHKQKPSWAGRRVKARTGKAPLGVFVQGLGWTRRDSFKVASKGVNLLVEDLISVCEGQERTSKQAAPTYSLKRGTTFTVRRVNRADKRKLK